MIYESFPWKQDLLQRKRLILKYNHSELLSEENDRAYTVIEKAIFYSAFIIRKLIVKERLVMKLMPTNSE